MKHEIIQTLLTKLCSLADTVALDQEIELYLSHLQEQVRQVQQFQGKEPPIGGRKYYLLTCLSSLSLDCASLYVAFGSLEQLLEYWQPDPLPGLLRTATPWEYAMMQFLESQTRLYRLTHMSIGGSEYAWKSLIRGALADLLNAIDQCAMLLGSSLEQRMLRALDGLPVIPPSMQCLGTGLLSWLMLYQDDGTQKRIVLLEGGDGSLVPLVLPEVGAYGQTYALVCEERDPSSEGRELSGVPYELPLLLGEGCVRYDLEISLLPHACWLLADDGTADPWDQEALHRVDYRYAHLLFLPMAVPQFERQTHGE